MEYKSRRYRVPVRLYVKVGNEWRYRVSVRLLHLPLYLHIRRHYRVPLRVDKWWRYRVPVRIYVIIDNRWRFRVPVRLLHLPLY